MTKLIQMADIWGKKHWIDESQLKEKSELYAEKVFGTYTTLKTYTKSGKEKRISSFYKIRGE